MTSADQARALITQAKQDHTYEAPIPEDDAKAIEEANALIELATDAWNDMVRGSEVETILRLAAAFEPPGMSRYEIVFAAEDALADIDSWPTGDSIEPHVQYQAGALPGTDSELAAAILSLYCYFPKGEPATTLMPISYCSDHAEAVWHTDVYRLDRFVLWVPRAGCMHVTEYPDEDAAHEAARAIEEPRLADDHDYLHQRFNDYCWRLGLIAELSDQEQELKRKQEREKRMQEREECKARQEQFPHINFSRHAPTASSAPSAPQARRPR